MHDEVDGHLLGFQVTHVDDPDAVDTTLVGEIQLLTQFGYSGRIDPTVVPWTAIHIDVVVESQTSLALSFKVAPFTADIAPVVVAEQQRDIIWHGEPRIVVALHFRKDGPELRHGIGTSVDVADNLALAVDNASQCLHVLLVVALPHRHVTIATHADRHEVVVSLIALHTFTEELVDARFIRRIVPRTHLLFAVQILLMGAHHRLMVTGAHHDTHLVGQSRALGIILIEGRCPHGRPEIVGLQAQEQLKDMFVSLCVHTPKVVSTPRAKRGPLVINEKATILHLRRWLDESPAIIIQFVLMLHRRICHPIPRRHPDTLREVVDAIDGATLVTARNDKIAVNHVDQIRFPLSFNLTHIYLSLFDEFVDDTAFADGTYEDGRLEILALMGQQTSGSR